MVRKGSTVSEKGHGKKKIIVKRAQETNDTSELNIQSRENKKHKLSSKEKDMHTMHKLTSLVEAANIVESAPATEGKPGRRKSRNPQKTMMAVVKPTPKSGKGIKRIKENSRRHSSNSDVDVDGMNDESDLSSSDLSDTDEESYEDLKKKVTLMMSRIEKFETKKKKKQRKRKNRKGKHLSDRDKEDDEMDVKPSKSQKKMTDDNSNKKSKENNEVTTSVAPDNSMMFQLQYQQMMMQQMYMLFQPPYNFHQPYNMPHVMPTAADPNVSLHPSGSPSTAMIIPGSSTSKSAKSSSASATQVPKTLEQYINVDIHSKAESRKPEKKSRSGHSQNDTDSDASEVYEPDVMKSAEPKSSEENITTTIIPTLPSSDPTPSFLNFCEVITDERKDNVSSTVRSSITDPSLESRAKCTKEPTVSEERSIVSSTVSKDPKKSSSNRDVSGLNIADVLMNLIPPQVRKEINISGNKESEEDRSEINAALRRLISENPDVDTMENSNSVKNALLRLLSDDQSQLPRNFPQLETKHVKYNPPPLEKHPLQEKKGYSDSSSWMRECLHNLYLQDQDGDTILHILTAKEDECGAIEIIKRMKGYRMDILNALGQTPLHLAMYIKSTKIIEALLQHGADISIVDAHGNSPLHIACEEDSLEMVKVLFEYQMSHRAKYEKIMKIRNNQGLAAVHISTHKENEEILKFLVRNKIDLNIQEGRSGNTPLVMALSKGNWGLAEFFMDNGANVNIPNFSNCYPLHFAVQGNKMDMVKTLLSCGAEMGSKANEYDNGKDSEIKSLLAKEMRKRRRQKARMEEKC